MVLVESFWQQLIELVVLLLVDGLHFGANQFTPVDA
jgi:hypothetical protein